MRDLTVSVAEILGRPGEFRDVTIRRPLEGVRTALARLDGSDFTADLRLESVVEGVLVTGRVTSGVRLECARCLKEFDSDVTLEVCELFATPPGHELPKDEDVYEVGGTEIDLEPMLRDATTLALPLNPLCDEACRGLCARCGIDLNSGECTCTDDDVDPRWAPLAELRDKLSG